FDDGRPFFRIGVAFVMLEQLRAEHVELARIPARHDIESEPSLADAVSCGAFLGGEDRVDRRHMASSGCNEGVGRCQQARRCGPSSAGALRPWTSFKPAWAR